MLSLIIKITVINMKSLIMFMLLSEQAREQPTWSVRSIWRPRAPCWWPLA